MKKTIKIKKGQYLKDVIDIFPNNSVINKTVTEIGATSLLLEHESKNCIICVPNQPVIKGKSKKYNKYNKVVVKGVYDGITVNDITAYLNSPQTPKRILTTPESFHKVKSAINDSEDYELYRDFFFLLDECERLVQDVDYRNTIIDPVDDFFKFNEKAMISATTIEMTDPRFKANNVKQVTIVPQYDYKQDLKLITTNNIELSLRTFINENPREQYFIFHNSVDSIGTLIKKMDIVQESAIFCSRDAAKRMKGEGNDFVNVHQDIRPFKKYNFLTSRFFSALDIDNISNPTIIMLTDIQFADFTTIDPLTQAIQIQGRFRKIKQVEQVKEIIHITNFKPTTLRNDDDLLKDIETGKVIHRYLKGYLAGATTIGSISTINEMLKTIQNKMAITEDSEVNHFLKDNMLFDNKVNRLYTDKTEILNAYKCSKHFKVVHFEEEYLIDDKVRIELLNFENIRPKSLLELLVNGLEKIEEIRQTNPLQAALEEISLMQYYPEQSKVINELTLKTVRELDFDIRKIRIAIKDKRLQNELSNFEFINYLEEKFLIGSQHTSKSYKRILRQGISYFGLIALKPTISLLRTYFEVEEGRIRIGSKQSRVYTIIARNQYNRQIG